MHQVFQIKVRDRNHIDKLKGLSNMQNSTLTFWNLPATPGHPVNVPASLELVKSFLESHGLAYSVSIKDLQAVIDKENEEMKFNTRKEQHDGNFNYGAYHSLDEFSTGKNKRPAIWLNYGIHAREWITQATGIWTARKIASDFSGNNPNMTSILDKMDIFLMPVANPDRYIYSPTKDKLGKDAAKALHSLFGTEYLVGPFYRTEFWGGALRACVLEVITTIPGVFHILFLNAESLPGVHRTKISPRDGTGDHHGEAARVTGHSGSRKEIFSAAEPRTHSGESWRSGTSS
ncbi:carboxypeptidase A4-like isoform X2 [Sminthopsis crassicaudata]|uniref:carboxypeptidase A4-like isoform X2 n=1 Tax=Sminthopsis crassicaudata TaxID=9301 RepID=UPI003D6888C4